MIYDVTTIVVRPGTHPKALSRLQQPLSEGPSAAGLLACWYSEIGALNRILILRQATDAAAALQMRAAILASNNPFGIAEFIVSMSMDSYAPFDFVKPMHAGEQGPVFEVRTYTLKPDGVGKTAELWRRAVPGREQVSPLLAAMTSLTGPVTRFMHIWPYRSLDERQRLRAKAVADGVWPPPGGPDQLLHQDSDIYLPAAFSPIR